MSDDSYQARVAKLSEYYKQAHDNSGTPQLFYTYLYKYVQTIEDDPQLFDAAYRLWLTKLFESLDNDEDKVRELAKPLLDLGDKMPNIEQQFQFFQNINRHINAQNIKEIKVYYCWYVLYFNFYGLYKLKPEALNAFGNADLSKLDYKQALGRDLTAKEKQALANFNKADQKKFATLLENAVRQLVPSGGATSHDVFVSSLNIFHIEFMEWLKQYPSHADSNKPIIEQTKTVIGPITNLKLEPKNYDAANGVLNIAGHQIEIIKQPNKKGSAIKESRQARVMRLVFNDVNTMKDGVPMRKILSVRASDFGSKHRKLAKSYVSEINGKLPKELGIKELLISNQSAVMVDSRYLL